MTNDTNYTCPACQAWNQQWPDDAEDCLHTPEMGDLARAFAVCCCDTECPTLEQVGWYIEDAEETIAEAGPRPWHIEKLLTDLDRDDIRHAARRYEFAYLVNGRHVFAIDNPMGGKEHVPPHYVCSLPVVAAERSTAGGA